MQIGECRIANEDLPIVAFSRYSSFAIGTNEPRAVAPERAGGMHDNSPPFQLREPWVAE